MSVTPSRPYLLRALYQWLNDNGLTAHLMVDATVVGVDVPPEHVQDGQIVLNVAPGAVQGLLIDEQGVGFTARFGGVPRSIYVPMAAVLAIYARENGMGMGFGMEPGAELLAAAPGTDPTGAEPGGGRPDAEGCQIAPARACQSIYSNTFTILRTPVTLRTIVTAVSASWRVTSPIR